MTGMTKAFFHNVVLCEDTGHGYAEGALPVNVLSTGRHKVILQRDQEPNSIDVKHKTATPMKASNEPNRPSTESCTQGLHTATGQCDNQL